jgi:diketogulonate reductase-like aldo/keto reductase
MSVPDLTLSNGNTIPQIGLGLWQVTDEEQFQTAFKAAVKAGYRHFDSAQAYHNEDMLGRAWNANKLKREDIFLTTKIFISNFKPKKLHESFEESLKNLQTDYVDLLLLHFPVTLLRKKAWLALEDIQTSGMAKNIGVSNFTIRHLEELAGYANQMPVVNQVEMHVFLQQPELVKYCKDHNIRIEAYSPLARAHIMDNETVSRIAEKYNKTYAQVLLRFLVERGLVVLPKSVTPKRIEENFNIFDFSLDKDDMKDLEKEDLDKRFCWSPVHVP